MSHPIIEIRQPGRSPIFVQLREDLQLGRECDGILLADPQASRVHARLRRSGNDVLVEDLGSTNGTFVDGNAVSTAVPVPPGSTLQVGDTVLHVLADEPAPVQAAGGGPVASRETAMPGSASFGGAMKSAAGAEPTNIRETSMDAVARSVEKAPPPVPDAKLHEGTITIVFSDIESSTERATAMGDARWMKVLGAHNDIITRHVDKWGGTVVKNQGDGFMLTFTGARQALMAMIGVQKDLEEQAATDPDNSIRIRVGVHTGEVIAEEGDIFGKHVMLAARVGGLAEGGQIVVSSIVKEIASARGDLEFGEGQTVALKGIAGDHIVYPLDWRAFSES